MASAKFPSGSEGLLDRTIDLTGDVRVMLVLSSYTYDSTDVFVADLGAVDNGRSAALGSKTYTGGVFDAADTTITATAATASSALVYFQHTGSDATARLIAYVNVVTSGLPLTPSVSQIVNITHDNGANKIFKI